MLSVHSRRRTAESAKVRPASDVTFQTKSVSVSNPSVAVATTAKAGRRQDAGHEAVLMVERKAVG